MARSVKAKGKFVARKQECIMGCRSESLTVDVISDDGSCCGNCSCFDEMSLSSAALVSANGREAMKEGDSDAAAFAKI